MSDVIAPGNDVTFTITRAPRTSAAAKTIRRLMRMQPDIQKGLRMLARRRRQKDNKTYIRAGVEWTDRARTTKLTHVKPGESFTIRVSPHILGDIKSVDQYLEASKA